MKFNDCIKNVSTFLDLKRFANEYVIDYKRLSIEELKSAIIKTSPQYDNEENLKKVITFFELNPDRNIRILFNIFIKNILLNSDDFTESIRNTEDRVIAYEQEIINSANEYSLNEEISNLELYKYVVEAAWESNEEISIDEQNLINKIKSKLKILDKQHQILEAKLGKFPTINNVPHTKDEVSNIRRLLQNKGIIISVRDSNNIDYDVIPEEIATAIRKIFNIDIKESSFLKLLDTKYVKNKNYLIDILSKANVPFSKYATVSQLKELIVKHLTAHQVLGGFSALDGLDKTTLSEWCTTIKQNPYGTKLELIEKIIKYYDEIKQIEVCEEDERELYYKYFVELSQRKLNELRQQGVINKDLECEHKFEQATNFIFEKIFKVKPLIMNGTEHPDGILSFNDKLIMWDNKSKETDVSLIEHIKQFDRYIKTSPKPVSVFMVIAPSFTNDSIKECAKYAMNSDTLILLITANELKELSKKWSNNHSNDSESLPLGIFKQNGRFNSALIEL